MATPQYTLRLERRLVDDIDKFVDAYNDDRGYLSAMSTRSAWIRRWIIEGFRRDEERLAQNVG